jgi:hypothetical protein
MIPSLAGEIHHVTEKVSSAACQTKAEYMELNIHRAIKTGGETLHN